MNGKQYDEVEVLRSGLHAEADLITISPPPIALVRRRTVARRRWRWTVQGLSGVAVTCALVGGFAVWAPGRQAADGPLPPGASTPHPTGPARNTPTTPATPTSGTSRPSWGPSTSPSTSPSGPTPSRTPPTNLGPGGTGQAAAHLTAADLGPGWSGPVGAPIPRTTLTIAPSTCEAVVDETPATSAWSLTFGYDSSPGVRTNLLVETVYTFLQGEGPGVMTKVRAALGADCAKADQIKALTAPAGIGDDVVVYSLGGGPRDILVRIGDRVACTLIDTVPSGAAGDAFIAQLAEKMADRLTFG